MAGASRETQCPGADLKGVGVLQTQERTEQGGRERGHLVRRSGRSGKVGDPGGTRLAWGRGQGGSEELT